MNDIYIIAEKSVKKINKTVKLDIPWEKLNQN